jgi:hypothetical protein
MDNTSLSPAASNIAVACDFRLPPRPAVPRVILNDLGERIGDLVEKELPCRHFRCLVREASATKRSQNQRLGFQIETKKAKRLATSTVSIRQALNC